MAKARSARKSTTVLERRCRTTGTVVALAAPGVELEASEGWVTICRDHSGCMCHDSRRLAEQWWSHPEDWCPDCMLQSDTADNGTRDP